MISRCSDSENCVAYDPDNPECQKDNGCMTEENLKFYLEWVKAVLSGQND